MITELRYNRRRTAAPPVTFASMDSHSGRIDRHDCDELVDEFVQRCTELTPSQAATINLVGLGPPQLTTRAVAELGAERARLQALAGLDELRHGTLGHES